MVSLTKKEREALLILFKDFTTFYNANSISRIIETSHVGAQKILKRLMNDDILLSQRIGKAIIYRLNLKDDYTCKLISFLLADEANTLKRWKEEFKELSKKAGVVMMFGSAVKNYAEARDIDIMIIIKKEDFKDVADIIKQKQKLLPKRIHSIELTMEEFLENVKNKRGATIKIIKDAVVLYGQDRYVEIIKECHSPLSMLSGA